MCNGWGGDEGDLATTTDAGERTRMVTNWVEFAPVTLRLDRSG